MNNNFVERLARKWVDAITWKDPTLWTISWFEANIAGAIREALQEAEKIAREHPECHSEPKNQSATGCAYSIADQIANIKK